MNTTQVNCRLLDTILALDLSSDWPVLAGKAVGAEGAGVAGVAAGVVGVTGGAGAAGVGAEGASVLVTPPSST